MLEYFLQFFHKVFSPELDQFEIVVEYAHSPTLQRCRDPLDVLALLSCEG